MLYLIIAVVAVVATLLIIKHNQKGAAVVEDKVQTAADAAKAEAEKLAVEIKKKL